MPERGGPAAQAGFLYQNTIAVEFLAKMLVQDQISGVRCEAPEFVDDIVLYQEDTKPFTFVSVKRNLPTGFGSWTKKLKIGIWESFKKQFQENPEKGILLITSSPLNDLKELCTKAESSLTLEEFNNRLTISQKNWYNKIQQITSLDHDIMKKLLSRIKILDSYGNSEKIRENIINSYLEPNFFDSKKLFSFLLELIIKNSEKRQLISKNELLKLMKENNFIRLSKMSIDSILNIFRMCTEGSIEGIIDFIEINDEKVRIPFDEVREITNKLLQEETKRIVISGGGGCGKSGCIKQIAKSLLNSSLKVLLIRGEL